MKFHPRTHKRLLLGYWFVQEEPLSLDVHDGYDPNEKV